MTGKTKENKIGLMLIFVGIIGTVLFFPMKLENGRTCMVQHSIQGEGVHTEGNSMMVQGHSLAQYYVFHYGLFWWVSIGLIVTGFYLVRKKKLIAEDLNRGQKIKTGEAARMGE